MANAQRVHHAIDSGHTRDKVRARDLSVAPLGTDDEAAGRRASNDWLPPERGDHLADGDPGIGALYEVRGEGRRRAPATAQPDWRLWIGIGFFGLAMAVAIAGAALVA